MRREEWGWRKRWRLYVAVLAGVAALVTIAAAVLHGGPEHPVSLVLEPTPDATATTDVAPTSGSTPAPSASAGAVPELEPTSTPGASLSPTSAATPVRTIDVSQAGMLSDRFAEDAFGQGRRARVDVVSGSGTRVFHACYDTDAYPPDVGPRHVPRRVAGRTWSWADEIVASEVLLELESAEAAANQVVQCKLDPDPAYQEFMPNAQDVSRPVAVGDGGFVSRIGRNASTTMYSGAQVGRFVVLVNWRQSGRHVPLDPLEHALRAAVLKGTRGLEAPALASSTPVPLNELTGYLTRDEIPGEAVPHEGLVWWSDVGQGRSSIGCGYPATTYMPTTREVHLRAWMASTGPGLYDNDTVSLAFARAPDPASAGARFQECRAAFASGAVTKPESGLGDEAFSASADLSNGDVLARTGDLYLWVHFANRDLESALAVARAALTTYLASASP